MSRRLYVGLASTFHDPAIALVDEDGEVLFAEGAERSLQDKRAFHCPPDRLAQMASLLDAHAGPDTQVVLARSWSGPPTEEEARQHLDQVRLLAPGAYRELQLREAAFILPAMAAMQGVTGQAVAFLARKRGLPEPIVRAYDHHLTHAVTAVASSPFEDAAVAIVDGLGEAEALSFYAWEGGRLRSLQGGPQGANNASLGHFYAALTVACGFDDAAGEEWKVMGLAPYGEVDRALYHLLRPMFVHPAPLRLAWADDAAARLSTMLDMRPAPGQHPITRADLARTGQQVYADVATQLLRELHAAFPSRNLALGGGCGLNSSYNGEILGLTPFEHLHVFAAPADDGNAIGAALLAREEDHGPLRPRGACLSPFLGSRPRPAKIEALVALGGLRPACRPDQVFDHAARLLSEGKILAWMRGRAEFGPRALGNRSILADPRDPGMKDKLNARVKFREEFRPFAPSILHEHGPAYFERYEFSPYMERALQFRPEVYEEVPAVVHVNGTGRLQSVTRELNPDYYRLIETFYGLTGVPMLLDTSLNVMGRPIVHSVEDAVAVFFTSGIDALVIEDHLFEKSI